jgi:uncharacterized protein
MTMSGPVLSSSKPLPISVPIGWPLFATPDADGRLRWPDLATSVKQRIEAILRTAPGEQLMRPEFGAGLETVLHRPNTTQLRAALQSDLSAHLSAYEPRMLLDQIAVESAGDGRELIISIAYRLRSNGASGQLSVRVPVGGA